MSFQEPAKGTFEYPRLIKSPKWARSLASFLAYVLAGTQIAQANCFSQSDLRHVSPAGLKVEMPSPCPMSNKPGNYAFFPQTNCTALDLTSAMSSRWTAGEIDHRIWANRWNGGKNKAPNPISPAVKTSSGKQCRLQYTSIAKADAATEAETAATLGYAPHDVNGFGYLDWTEAAGFSDSNVYDYTTFKANADSLCTQLSGSYLLATDVVVLPVVDVTNVPVIPRQGVEIDYEVQDNHTVDQTNAVLTAVSQMVHEKGYEFLFYTNPLDGDALVCCSGINSGNLDYIQSMADRFGILVYQNNPEHKPMVQSLSDQIALFQHPDFLKLVLTVDLAMSVDNARLMRQAMLQSYPFSGISMWMDGTNLRGTCTSTPNQVLGIISGITQ